MYCDRQKYGKGIFLHLDARCIATDVPLQCNERLNAKTILRELGISGVII